MSTITLEQAHILASRLVYAPCPVSRNDVHPATAVETFKAKGNWSSKSRLQSLDVKSNGKCLGKMKLLTAMHRDNENRETYVFVHGRSGGLGSVIDLANHVYEQGSNVVMFNYVGEQGNDGNISQETAVASMQTALLHLEKVIGLRPEKINIVGPSMGADTTAIAVGKLCQADPKRKYGEIRFVATPILKEVIPVFIKMDAAMARLNDWLGGGLLQACKLEDAMQWLSKIRARKVSIHHGLEDKSVPYCMGQQWFKALEAATDVDITSMVSYPDCGHGGPQYRMFGIPSPEDKAAKKP
jgi:acetyl esterase/lipase